MTLSDAEDEIVKPLLIKQIWKITQDLRLNRKQTQDEEVHQKFD